MPSTERAEPSMALREALEEFDHQLESWARAYPESVFPEPDMTLVRTALEARGITIDAVSASNMRHVATTLNKLFEPVRRSSSSGAGDAAVETKEPFAYALMDPRGEVVMDSGTGFPWLSLAPRSGYQSDYDRGCYDLPLYAEAPIKQEMPEALSKEQIFQIADSLPRRPWGGGSNHWDAYEFARAIERAVIAQKGKGENGGA